MTVTNSLQHLCFLFGLKRRTGGFLSGGFLSFCFSSLADLLHITQLSQFPNLRSTSHSQHPPLSCLSLSFYLIFDSLPFPRGSHLSVSVKDDNPVAKRESAKSFSLLVTPTSFLLISSQTRTFRNGVHLVHLPTISLEMGEEWFGVNILGFRKNSNIYLPLHWI